METLSAIEILALVVAGIIVAAFCVAFYYRKIKGYSADMKKRDEKGNVIK